MIALETFVKNPFADPKISFVNFRKFAFHHLGCLKSTNPGNVYDANIAATQAAFDQFDAAFGSKTVEEAIRKGATFELGVTVDTVLAATRNLEMKVSLAFNNPSAIYLQFFPRGLTEFNNAGRGDWPSLLIRLKTATETHKGVLGQPVATEFAGYQANYSTAENTQAGSTGNLEDLRQLTVLKRAVLSDAVFANLLGIAQNNRGNEAIIKIYFDPSIVNPKVNKDNDGKANVNGMVIRMHDHVPIGQVEVLAKNSEGQILGNTSTAADGSFRMTSLPPGMVAFIFTKEGFQPYDMVAEVLDYEDVEVNAQLAYV